MANILGLNAYHGDSSACLIVDGVIVAAAEEERFQRIKHWAGFPAAAIGYCLKEGRLTLGDVDIVAINSDPAASLWRKIRYTISGRPNFSLIREKITTRKRRGTVEEQLAKVAPQQKFNGTVCKVEHHLAHLASCFYVSGFQEAVALSIDGFGDFSSAAWGMGFDDNLSVDDRIYFPHSMGVFYQALTQYLGFPNYGDEYKVMGLAPYGVDKYATELRSVISLSEDGKYALNLDFFRHHKNKIGYEWVDSEPRVSQLYSNALEELLGPARRKEQELTQEHKNIAHAVQATYELAFFHLLNSLHRRYGTEKLTLAGGCAMNSVANGKIRSNTAFDDVYIQSAAGDAGGAIGAGLVATKVAGDNARATYMDHAYYGPHSTNESIGVLLTANKCVLGGEDVEVSFISDENVLCRVVAKLVADGNVVGWFQGRMEWGPRALGNRSIICDPRRGDMKEILNKKIKRRESFRPFAPSILREYVGEWFETDDDVPFMMKVYKIRKEKQALIPAVTHVDGTGRLQTVYRKTNQRYYRLIEEYLALTDVPMVLNTSFNENEPVVCSPQEALDCFLRTKMDVLVMESYCLKRRSDDSGRDG